ncbi:uncharacterized protein LOC123310542 isoform X3 [Coccinella septempunctata]|uniref:uncharacterized protein LOC123310542 isoform X3 n=1 Tax=Coccinella septempunctata TaxID=41139 RepID=UPI001D093E0D|nr:uncharacterized protein LOC123310542 isoform X3 [Coccinella septempunctata]
MFYRNRKYRLVATKKKFWNRLKWFKRKNKVIEDSVLPVSDYIATSESLRSRSTSELSIEEPPRKRNGSSMYPGLSVSHDSVFHSPQSGSETDLDVGHSSSSLCIPTQPHAAELQTELSERLRLRRSGGGRGDTSEDDEGFPHSLCNSPTTTDNIDKTALKDLPNKSHSTCSDGSLLSVGSSDIEEDLLISQIRHSSKSTLSENKHDFDLNTTSIPLNHSAAHHRVSVKPKKTHGVPRRRRGVQQQLPNTLPTTIEVNEDSSIRSSSPEAIVKDNAIELCNTSGNHPVALTETQLKSSSLPLGLVPPGSDGRLNRSRSNAGSKSQDALEEREEKEEKCDRSFFERLFPRRSAKKKKAKTDEKKQEEKKIKLEESSTKHDDKKQEERRKSEDVKGPEVFRPIGDKFSSMEDSFTPSSYSKQASEGSNRRYEAKPRSGPTYRQRVIPVDVPDSPGAPRKDDATKSLLPDILSTSPLHLELENKLKQRLTLSSPPQSFDLNAELKDEEINASKPPRFVESKHEESRYKIKLAGLSSLQQKVLILNEDEGDFHNFKSLTEFPTTSQASSVLLTKSHSFKSAKSTTTSQSTTKTVFGGETKEISIGKSSSLDSMKLLDGTEQVRRTERMEHQRQIRQQTVEIKCDVTVNEGDNLDEEITRQMMETKSICDNYRDKSHITISGPSHTAVVNVKNDSEYFSLIATEETKVDTVEKVQSPKEHLVSITKINVQPETEQLSPKSPPVILESKSILSSKSPKWLSDQARSRPVFNFETDNKRKFSQDNVEIVDKEAESPKTPPHMFKKNEKTAKKTSVVSLATPDSPTRDKSINSLKSSSCDSLASDHFDSTDRSSQDSLDHLADKKADGVVLRKKASLKDAREDEPELMKVFARRSLKLKDPENESLSQQLSVMMKESCDRTRDSDKENQTESPVKERKRSKDNFAKLTEDEPQSGKKRANSKSDDEDTKKPLIFELEKKDKEPLIESNVPHSKPIPIRRNSRSENHSLENVEVTLRKPAEQNPYVRCVSVNSAKNIDNSQNILRKQFVSRRRTDNWITNIKNEDADKEAKDVDAPKDQTGTELIIEPKNFNQRKAEWEKRAQEAQKKSP